MRKFSNGIYRASYIFPGQDIKKKNNKIVRLFITYWFYDNYH